MMRRKLTSLVAGVTVAAAVGVAMPASPAQAACGQMDLGRDPSTYVELMWGTSKTTTWIEPHHGTQNTYAVIARYVSGSGVRYWFGNPAFNANSAGRNLSTVSSSTGTYSGNYYRYGTSGSLGGLYRDYAPRAGWTYGC